MSEALRNALEAIRQEIDFALQEDTTVDWRFLFQNMRTALNELLEDH